MGSGWSKVGQAAGSLVVLMLLLLCPAPAFAHKLYVVADSIEGATIHGRAYFQGDVPAQHSDVIVRDATGRELGRTKTDDKGKFTFTAREHVDHCLVAETPDGHTAQHVVLCLGIAGQPARGRSGPNWLQLMQRSSELLPAGEI